MADTPFINSLSEEDKAKVRKRAQKVRPSYTVGTLQAQSARSTTTGNEKAVSANVQISEDLEAALILMPAQAKTDLIAQMQGLSTQGSTPDDLALMAQVLGDRTSGFANTILESQRLSSKYEATRLAIIDYLMKVTAPKTTQTSSVEPPTAVLIPDLSNMFQMISTSLADFEKREIMAVHDIVVDQLVVAAYFSQVSTKGDELLSWIKIFLIYNSV